MVQGSVCTSSFVNAVSSQLPHHVSKCGSLVKESGRERKLTQQAASNGFRVGHSRAWEDEKTPRGRIVKTSKEIKEKERKLKAQKPQRSFTAMKVRMKRKRQPVVCFPVFNSNSWTYNSGRRTRWTSVQSFFRRYYPSFPTPSPRIGSSDVLLIRLRNVILITLSSVKSQMAVWLGKIPRASSRMALSDRSGMERRRREVVR